MKWEGSPSAWRCAILRSSRWMTRYGNRSKSRARRRRNSNSGICGTRWSRNEILARIPVFATAIHDGGALVAAGGTETRLHCGLVSVRRLESVLLHGQVQNHEEMGGQVRDHHQGPAVRLCAVAR